ncbi:F-box domain-containing protein [Mycena kentingensis (nom. inval.)]|nr:F-box domain-containing protein [Mycena kentingensis (nom. inval.)]
MDVVPPPPPSIMRPTPFQDILRTNAVPSDDECDQIRAFLAEPARDLAALTERTKQLRIELQAAQRELADLVSFITDHQALISPFRRIPDDLLRLIFMHTLPATRNTALVAEEGPLLLCSVSRHWRDVALTTPRLWSCMHIVVPEERRMDALKAVLSTWLQRSGAVPLSFSMRISRRNNAWGAFWASRESPSHVTTTLPILPLLAAASSRWDDVQLVFTKSDDLRVLANLDVDDVTNLRSIALVTDSSVPAGTASPPTPSPTPLPFLATKSLRRFKFDGHIDLLPLNVVWPQLTELSLNIPAVQFPASLPFPLPLLRECVALQRFNLALSGYNLEFAASDAESQSSAAAAFLPQLTHIELTIDMRNTQSNGSRIFRALVVPALASLCLVSTTRNLPELFRPIASTLKTLHIPIDALTTEALRSGLELLHVLEELIMVGEPNRPPQTLQTHPPAGIYNPVRKDRHWLACFLPLESASPPDEGILLAALRRLELTRVALVSDELIAHVLRSRVVLSASTFMFQCTVYRTKQLDLHAELADLLPSLELKLSYREPIARAKYSAVEGTELDVSPSGGFADVEFFWQ